MLKIRELRIEKNATQQEIADKIGVSRQVFANWENEINQPDLKMLILLADYFGVSADYLLGRSDDFGNVNIQSTVPALSEKEETLLRYFRTLSEELQGVALDTVCVLAGAPAGNGLQKKA